MDAAIAAATCSGSFRAGTGMAGAWGALWARTAAKPRRCHVISRDAASAAVVANTQLDIDSDQ